MIFSECSYFCSVEQSKMFKLFKLFEQIFLSVQMNSYETVRTTVKVRTCSNKMTYSSNFVRMFSRTKEKSFIFFIKIILKFEQSSNNFYHFFEQILNLFKNVQKLQRFVRTLILYLQL